MTIVRKEEFNDITGAIVDACVDVHKTMGPGLLESVYEQCLARELEIRKMPFLCQVPIPLVYKGFELSKEFRIDMLVANEIVMEIKAVEALLPIHEAQLISYLKLTGKKLGLLVNFNVPVMKNGIRRFVNNF